MERTSSWLISMFIVMFWVFRVVVAIFVQTNSDFSGFIVFDYNKEIILLFITLLSFVFIFKRKILGAFIYLITYGYYFGGYLYTNLLPLLTNGNEISGEMFQNSAVCILALILPICVLIDILIDKLNRNTYRDSKTDWFFRDKNTDRKMDQKADKNQYKIY